MAIQSKHHHPSPVKEVRVSQGSRSDAAGVKMPRFETYEEEYQWWVSRKRQLESEFGAYNKTAMSAENSRIRREYPDDANRSFDEWAKRERQMNAKRHDLIVARDKAEEELGRLKPHVQRERALAHQVAPGRLEEVSVYREDGSLCHVGLSAQILLELRAIRTLLGQLVADRAENREEQA